MPKYRLCVGVRSEEKVRNGKIGEFLFFWRSIFEHHEFYLKL